MKHLQNPLFISLAIVLLGVSSGLAGSYLGLNWFVDEITQENKVETRILDEESAVIEVVEGTQNAVVSIIITKDIPIFEEYYYNPFENFGFNGFGFSVPQQGEQIGSEEVEVGSGSGFFVREDGLIVTNRHVVEDEEAQYSVILNDGQILEAEVLDRDTVYDIAFLKVDGENFNTILLGSTDDIKVGQGAIAIGNALGEFSNTVSTGIISGLGRNVTASSGYGNYVTLNDVIQTDASINPGNSGGPLLDLAGNGVGVNVAVASNAENIGFAIPIDYVKNALESIEEHGEILRPYLGIRYTIITPSLQEANGLEYDYGALVVRGDSTEELAVIPGSPADKAGITENDIILEVNGTKIDEDNQLSFLIQKYAIGESLELKMYSKGEEKSVTITLEENPL